jgi:hypothetical protein
LLPIWTIETAELPLASTKRSDDLQNVLYRLMCKNNRNRKRIRNVSGKRSSVRSFYDSLAAFQFSQCFRMDVHAGKRTQGHRSHGAKQCGDNRKQDYTSKIVRYSHELSTVFMLFSLNLNLKFLLETYHSSLYHTFLSFEIVLVRCMVKFSIASMHS